MPGSYCRYCDHRCFVLRRLPDSSWQGHMATCPKGMAHDRAATGYDHKTAINPTTGTYGDGTPLRPTAEITLVEDDVKHVFH